GPGPEGTCESTHEVAPLGGQEREGQRACRGIAYFSCITSAIIKVRQRRPDKWVEVIGENGGRRMGTEVAERGGPSPVQERAWVSAAQRGDRGAFAHLVEAYWPRLYRWLYQLTHDCHAAEDLAQEAFLKALAHLGRFQAGTNFRAWLFRIAHNTFAN